MKNLKIDKDKLLEFIASVSDEIQHCIEIEEYKKARSLALLGCLMAARGTDPHATVEDLVWPVLLHHKLYGTSGRDYRVALFTSLNLI